LREEERSEGYGGGGEVDESCGVLDGLGWRGERGLTEEIELEAEEEVEGDVGGFSLGEEEEGGEVEEGDGQVCGLLAVYL
jgi:hypothetical protein